MQGRVLDLHFLKIRLMPPLLLTRYIFPSIFNDFLMDLTQQFSFVKPAEIPFDFESAHKR